MWGLIVIVLIIAYIFSLGTIVKWYLVIAWYVLTSFSQNRSNCPNVCIGPLRLLLTSNSLRLYSPVTNIYTQNNSEKNKKTSLNFKVRVWWFVLAQKNEITNYLDSTLLSSYGLRWTATYCHNSFAYCSWYRYKLNFIKQIFLRKYENTE